MSDTFLEKTYELNTVEETVDHYNRWAESYDTEIAENNYATPGRIADALWSVLPDAEAPLLDFGCGTGLSGIALRRVGYEQIDGMDPSSEMLKVAQGKGAHRHLSVVDPDSRKPFKSGVYKAVVACGVLGTGAAPASVFGHLMHCLNRGDLLAFSLNDHALADPSYIGAMNEWLDCGAARLLFKEHGPHLPGLNLNACVYVIEKV
ncbi:Methyltransferase type 11 [Ruegeria sp. TM1040]|uniref:class I SAM-dependent DNA methyltransferase n=1 Tax=Ruegeria sp. (strain TM1040) TaxID=292414 RepID=UPI000046246A|nr:methyltransferase domain-containing protein [Ruegeria sp. TM1040]ABF64125.1 Methyltransferase type 11 [Ruegeria sp. TM1040]